jgi:hypothetical protein
MCGRGGGGGGCLQHPPWVGPLQRQAEARLVAGLLQGGPLPVVRKRFVKVLRSGLIPHRCESSNAPGQGACLQAVTGCMFAGSHCLQTAALSGDRLVGLNKWLSLRQSDLLYGV